MTVKLKGFRTTKRMLHDVEAFLRSTKPMEGIVEDVAEEIQKKTARAADYKNKPFEPYSPDYAKKKKTTHVDLRLSGRMLSSMRTKVINANHGRVFIKPAGYPKTRAKTDMVANIHTTGTGKQPQREFLNISKSAMAKIHRKNYDNPIMKILGRRK